MKGKILRVVKQSSIAKRLGPEEAAKNIRTCIASGNQCSKAGMVRFVIDPDSRPIPDLEEKLPGRGIWLTADRRLVHRACVKNLFAKKTRQHVHIDYDIPELMDKLMVRRCTHNLGLARRAGQAIVGFDKLRRALLHHHKGYVFLAHDGGLKGRKKITQLAGKIPMLCALTATEIGIAFGRNRVAYAFILPSGLGDSLFRDMRRLAGLRETSLAA